MDKIKERLPMIIAIIVAVTLGFISYYFTENYETVYYTKVDNTKVQAILATDNMKYEYTLDCYNEKGNKKEMKFKTSRELREEAYLMLEVRTMGVHSWKEVQYNEMPEKVKANYKE